MNAIPPSFTRSDAARPEALLPGSGRAAFGQGAANAMSMKWAALQDAAGAVAALAGCALLREFIAARDALLAMAPPSGALGPHRSA